MVLFAHDWGGVIAWYFALRGFGRSSRLVVMNLPHPASSSACCARGARGSLLVRARLPDSAAAEALFRCATVARDRGVSRHGRRQEPLSRRGPRRLPPSTRCEPGAMTAMMNYYRALVRGGGSQRQRASAIRSSTRRRSWSGASRTPRWQGAHLRHRALRPDLTLRYLPACRTGFSRTRRSRSTRSSRSGCATPHTPEKSLDARRFA